MYLIFNFLKPSIYFILVMFTSMFMATLIFSPGVSNALEEKIHNYSEEVVCSPFQNVMAFPEKHFCIDIADTPEETSRGLMFVEKIPENYGMLFNFQKEQQVFMWMSNTPLGLDMIFLDKNLCVNFVVQNTKPFSEDIITSPFPAQYVLEVGAGVSEYYGISPGSCASKR